MKLNWRPGDYPAMELRGSAVVLRKISLDDILQEAEEDCHHGKAATLRPKRE